ncbi:hypothetical protein [Rubripirellula lacrimiformis]|uniref:hypothetical protein n=1 Tax=Rubripirellula lacrimiformis TaxID=1930273 RepID=UPI001C54D54F|nr:hypothetical protein [Rubripirellula lacrimiformis]
MTSVTVFPPAMKASMVGGDSSLQGKCRHAEWVAAFELGTPLAVVPLLNIDLGFRSSTHHPCWWIDPHRENFPGLFPDADMLGEDLPQAWLVSDSTHLNRS